MELYIFETFEDPKFLLKFDTTWASGFLDRLRQHHPDADYPYLSLFRYFLESGENALCTLRPDSAGLGGQRGAVKSWSDQYDASTPEGLARMIDEEVKRPLSEHRHLNPSTCVVNFAPGDKTVNEAYEHLRRSYGDGLHIILLGKGSPGENF